MRKIWGSSFRGSAAQNDHPKILACRARSSDLASSSVMRPVELPAAAADLPGRLRRDDGYVRVSTDGISLLQFSFEWYRGEFARVDGTFPKLRLVGCPEARRRRDTKNPSRIEARVAHRLGG